MSDGPQSDSWNHFKKYLERIRKYDGSLIITKSWRVFTWKVNHLKMKVENSCNVTTSPGENDNIHLLNEMNFDQHSLGNKVLRIVILSVVM